MHGKQDFTRWDFKQALKQKNISQAYLAKILGKDNSWVSRISKGWIDPKDNDIERIASVLNVDKDNARLWFA